MGLPELTALLQIITIAFCVYYFIKRKGAHLLIAGLSAIGANVLFFYLRTVFSHATSEMWLLLSWIASLIAIASLVVGIVRIARKN